MVFQLDGSAPLYEDSDFSFQYQTSSGGAETQEGLDHFGFNVAGSQLLFLEGTSYVDMDGDGAADPNCLDAHPATNRGAVDQSKWGGDMVAKLKEYDWGLTVGTMLNPVGDSFAGAYGPGGSNEDLDTYNAGATVSDEGNDGVTLIEGNYVSPTAEEWDYEPCFPI